MVNFTATDTHSTLPLFSCLLLASAGLSIPHRPSETLPMKVSHRKTPPPMSPRLRVQVLAPQHFYSASEDRLRRQISAKLPIPSGWVHYTICPCRPHYSLGASLPRKVGNAGHPIWSCLSYQCLLPSQRLHVRSGSVHFLSSRCMKVFLSSLSSVLALPVRSWGGLGASVDKFTGQSSTQPPHKASALSAGSDISADQSILFLYTRIRG